MEKNEIFYKKRIFFLLHASYIFCTFQGLNFYAPEKSAQFIKLINLHLLTLKIKWSVWVENNKAIYQP
jgi:hypothetical protein